MDINLNEQKSILYVKPSSELSVENFSQLTMVIDAYIAQHGRLKGLIIETKQFPGWENIQAFIAHVKFIKKHQAKIQKIALVTNSKFAKIGKKCIELFVKPEIKHFRYDQIELAKQWIEK